MTELHRSRLVTLTRHALCALTLVSSLMATPGEGQVLYGSIVGAVKDPSDAAIPGARRLEFRGEAFNLTNTPKFLNPDGNVTSGTFMRILGTHNAYGERQFRLGLRFAF